MALSSQRGRTSKQPQPCKPARRSRCRNDSSDDDNDMPLLVDDDKHKIEEIDDDAAGGDDEMSDNSKFCLHCRTEATQVQVRCDECSSYICQDCHWCHEFQANHEVRVCDRCDAFYCRGCDEMDQCDDCGEVVCASCSTLLSCKFCGGGLCEECATACGRCGIVLCSRDAKFAVDCDTCRLSYCLVCLASGAKDPCARCGHRPSKRMEQLVHLRLKSIYKAFKQNSTGKSLSNDADDMADDPASLLQAAATAAKLNPGEKKKHRGNFSASSAQHPSHAQSCRRSNATDESVDLTQDRANQYKEEKEKADAAAAALLAELDEEQEAETKKKSKKNKKKARQQAKKEDEERKSPMDDPATGTLSNVSKKNDDDDFSVSDRSLEVTEPTASSIVNITESAAEAPLGDDPLEKEFVILVENEDEDGLESLLASIKGVPGRAVLRKNAKKALKRLRLANMPEVEEEHEVGSHSDHQSELEFVDDEPKNRARSETPPRTFVDMNGFLTVVSYSHNKHSAQNNPPGAHANSVRLRSECVMHMAPMIVGWVIGKGGVRIRDLMEDSGARVWIDQDSMGPGDPRTVYVSGSRKNVDAAVEMIQELVSQAPYSPLGVRQTTPVTTEASAELGKSKSVPNMPQPADLGKSSMALKPKGGVYSDGRSKQVLLCEPRFVPLLIGRRGWTIKNIQDSTGAKVDIDQTVNPRKITVSGPEENVERAIRMVRDVLSYPHAQLQGTAAEAAAAAETAAREKAEAGDSAPPPCTPAPSREKVEDANPAEEMNSRAGANSPPSSLIMTGDAQSTISASSSLSSTPEPSMTSVKANVFQHPPVVPLISPSQNRDLFAGVSDSMQNHFGHQQMQSQSPLAGPPIYANNVNLGNPGDTLFGGNIHHAVRRSDAESSMGTPLQQMGTIVSDLPSFNVGVAPRSFGNMPNDSLQSQGGAFNPLNFPPVAPGSSLHQPSPLFGNNGNAVNTPTSLWERASTPAELPRQSQPEGFLLGAAVEFLEHSEHRASVMPSTGARGGMNNVLGFGVGQTHSMGLLVHGTSAHGSLMSAQGRDDAQIIESLFGPAPGAAPQNVPSLLSDLHGLSLEGSRRINTTGLWNSAETTCIDASKGLPPIEGVAAPQPGLSGESLLFAGNGMASLSKPQSRFAWGEPGNS